MKLANQDLSIVRWWFGATWIVTGVGGIVWAPIAMSRGDWGVVGAIAILISQALWVWVALGAAVIVELVITAFSRSTDPRSRQPRENEVTNA